MSMRKTMLLLVLLAAAGLFSACGSRSKKASTEEIKAVTTFYPIYEFTKEVVGDQGTVEMLIPAGTEPHDFEPSAKDMAKITDADVFVYNSASLEHWVSKLETKKTRIIEAANGIHLEKSAGKSAEEGALDPHVWLDPLLAVKEVETIRDHLSEKFPKKKEKFQANAEKYIKQLRNLDQEYQDSLQNATNKVFVTQHAAFGYLAKQYGLTQEAIAGISPDEEPSPSRLSELKHYVEDKHVTVIYFEENVSSKVSETLAKETGVKLKVLNPLESLTNKEIDKGENYLSVMRENLAALKESIR